MSLSTRIFQFSRQKKFLYLMSLRTGAHFATLTLLLNKASSLYGLLAYLTGLPLSPIQLSMYIYSVFALALTAYLAPHIRTQSPFECVALAWFYVVDTIINAAYTAIFALTWFLVVSEHHSPGTTEVLSAGASMINDTAGFTTPSYTVSHVEVIATPAAGGTILAAAQDAIAVGSPASASAIQSSANPSLNHALLQPESYTSLTLIIFLWTIRIYLALVTLSFARQVLHQHMSRIRRSHTHLYSSTSKTDFVENPFAPHLDQGQGWKGKAGRFMVSIAPGFWFRKEEGSDVEEGWIPLDVVVDDGSKVVVAEPVVPGNTERERRRRSGTGPSSGSSPVIVTGTGVGGQFLSVGDVKRG
ncbi:MAG: hypothetical protein MMC33_008160 [Icmadophila ericetorum]|nr:hypothetical protein [Icmadophila ericetorum]